MLTRILPIILFATLIITGCSSNKQEQESQDEPVANEESTTESSTEESEEVQLEGYDTIEELAASVVESLKNKDYDSYYTHIMSEDMELAQASKIEDSVIRKEFLHEYGFSLHEEKEYFDIGTARIRHAEKQLGIQRDEKDKDEMDGKRIVVKA